MNRTDINVSGANGSGSSIKIYETPEYNYRRHGTCVMHGSFAAGPTSPDDQRIEVVELHLPGLYIRVRADDVRPALRALLTANKAWQTADCSAELQPARHHAFVNLQAAVFAIAGSGITVAHVEQIAHDGRKYADQKPAQVDLHLRPWSLVVNICEPRRAVPPAVVLSWDARHGGDLTQLEPIHTICHQALQEWTGDLSSLGEAAHG